MFCAECGASAKTRLKPLHVIASEKVRTIVQPMYLTGGYESFLQVEHTSDQAESLACPAMSHRKAAAYVLSILVGIMVIFAIMAFDIFWMLPIVGIVLVATWIALAFLVKFSKKDLAMYAVWCRLGLCSDCWLVTDTRRKVAVEIFEVQQYIKQCAKEEV